MNQAIITTADVMPAVRATGLLSSLCTFQQPSGTLDAAGAPDGTYSNVTGLVDIACTAPPLSVGSIAANEIKAVAEFLTVKPRHVLLDNYYAAADGSTAAGWRVVIDGITFDLMGDEHDSQRVMTRLFVRQASL